jgi:hypothetical protein
MGERFTKTGEQQYSPEQQQLIDSAHTLLLSPSVVQSGPYERGSRWVSDHRKIVGFLGRLARSRQGLINDYFGTLGQEEQPAYLESTAAVSLRGAGSEDNGGEPLYAWNSGVSLIQTIRQDLKTGTKHESLVIRAQAAVSNPEPHATQLMAYITKVLWVSDLLAPIDDLNEIQRLQHEIDSARQ